MSNGNNNQQEVIERPFPAYAGDKPYVFISYAHKDAKLVFEEIKKFHGEGYPVWYDQGLTPGQEWDDEIAIALMNASMLIVFISANSMASRNVQDEIKMALNRDIDIVPIYLEQTQLPPALELRLSNKHAIFKYAMTDKEYLSECLKAFRNSDIGIAEDLLSDSSPAAVEESHKTEDRSKLSTPYLEEFESLNTTTRSIFDLEDYNVLIILKDGTNLTGWNKVKDINDVLYVSENLSRFRNLSAKFKDFQSLKAVVASEISINTTDLSEMFSGCISLVDLTGISEWNTGNVKDMSRMFYDCDGLSDLSPLSGWDTGSVNDMSGMFKSCGSITDVSALSGWNTANVRNMNYMFDFTRNLIDISGLAGWNTSNVRNMTGMFGYCHGLRDLSGLGEWSTYNLTDTSEMFTHCDALVDVSGLAKWNMGKTSKMSSMFLNCESLVDLSALDGWNTGNVRDMNEMFKGCGSLVNVSGLSGWDTSKVINMARMFQGCASLEDVSFLDEWNVGNVDDMDLMFYLCSIDAYPPWYER